MTAVVQQLYDILYMTVWQLIASLFACFEHLDGFEPDSTQIDIIHHSDRQPAPTSAMLTTNLTFANTS
jgi:hypothetical protein